MTRAQHTHAQHTSGNIVPLLVYSTLCLNLTDVALPVSSLQGIVRHIGMLECVAGGISIADQNLKSAAQQGVSVTNGLHSLLLSASENSTPQGKSLCASICPLPA